MAQLLEMKRLQRTSSAPGWRFSMRCGDSTPPAIVKTSWRCWNKRSNLQMRTFSWKRSAAHARAMGRQRRAPKFIEVSLPRPLTRRQCEQFKLRDRLPRTTAPPFPSKMAKSETQTSRRLNHAKSASLVVLYFGSSSRPKIGNMTEVNMAKVVSCKDVGVDCDFVMRGETTEDILQQAAEHARTVHNMTEIPPDVAEKLRAAVRDEAA